MNVLDDDAWRDIEIAIATECEKHTFRKCGFPGGCHSNASCVVQYEGGLAMFMCGPHSWSGTGVKVTRIPIAEVWRGLHYQRRPWLARESLLFALVTLDSEEAGKNKEPTPGGLATERSTTTATNTEGTRLLPQQRKMLDRLEGRAAFVTKAKRYT